MNRVTYLGELKQMLLWVVLRLKDEALGLAIRDELERRGGRFRHGALGLAVSVAQ